MAYFLKFHLGFRTFLKTITKGQKFSDANITTKRSGIGIPAEKWDSVIGKISKHNFLYDENIKF